MPLIAVLHNKNGEVVVTQEGFQVMQFTEDFTANLVFHVEEPVAQHDLVLALTNPETTVSFRMQLGNSPLEPGEKFSIDLALLEAVNQHEAPRH